MPLINNIMAKRVTTPEEVKLSLVRQTSSHIYWWKCIEQFKDMDLIIEIGPNDKFSKLIKREWKDFPVYSINTQEDIDNLLKVIETLSTNKRLE
jgi:malonyl CoA-acyl carrier protein transacylase